VESLRAAVEVKANGKVTTQNAVLQSDPVAQKWQELECKNIELLCHIEFFEKAFETQQKPAFACTTPDIEKLLESNKVSYIHSFILKICIALGLQIPAPLTLSVGR